MAAGGRRNDLVQNTAVTAVRKSMKSAANMQDVKTGKKARAGLFTARYLFKKGIDEGKAVHG